MIVERIYTQKEVELPVHSLEGDRSFSEVEENALLCSVNTLCSFNDYVKTWTKLMIAEG